MICETEAANDIYQQATGVKTIAVFKPTWIDHVYSCDYDYPGGAKMTLSVKEVSSVDETTATRLADRLEAMGVARRRRDAADRRATEVVLTPSGERLAAEMSKRRLEFFRDVLASLDPDERGELVRLTAKATAALRARSEELVAR